MSIIQDFFSINRIVFIYDKYHPSIEVEFAGLSQAVVNEALLIMTKRS
jgi:hypothetical protein